MIVFRTDASSATGFGHFKRSFYLALLLKKRNKIVFIVNNDKIVQGFLKNSSIPFCLIDDFHTLLEERLTFTAFDIKQCSVLDIELLKSVKRKGIFTLQLTDLGLNQLDANVIIDHSPRKICIYNESEDLLTGLDYTILHHKFRHFNKVKRKYKTKVRDLFVSLGSRVQYNQLRPLVDLLHRHHYNIKVATGFCLKKTHRKTLRRIYSKIRFVGKTDTLARSLYEADVALITPGMLALEAAAVGTPSLYFYDNEAHRFGGEMYEKLGLGFGVSNIKSLREKEIIKKLNMLNWEKRTSLGQGAKDLVDGKGVYRILDFLAQKGVIVN
jgi:spore coat polysaccharide biosynthesis predicted glycosyltransferase SpsG